MTETCPHCGLEISRECNPQDSPDCWELVRLSASDHLMAEVHVTKGEEPPVAVINFLERLKAIETD